jgi:hypothetical protein
MSRYAVPYPVRLICGGRRHGARAQITRRFRRPAAQRDRGPGQRVVPARAHGAISCWTYHSNRAPGAREVALRRPAGRVTGRGGSFSPVRHTAIDGCRTRRELADGLARRPGHAATCRWESGDAGLPTSFEIPAGDGRGDADPGRDGRLPAGNGGQQVADPSSRISRWPPWEPVACCSLDFHVPVPFPAIHCPGR